MEHKTGVWHSAVKHHILFQNNVKNRIILQDLQRTSGSMEKMESKHETRLVG